MEFSNEPQEFNKRNFLKIFIHSNQLILSCLKLVPVLDRRIYNIYTLNTKKFFHRRCKANNRIGPHNIDIISTIFGLLLGDGYASNRSGEGVIISIKQSIIHKEYLFSLYEFFFLRGYCSNLIPRMYNRTIKGIDKIYYGYEFNTFTFRSFVWIYNSFYKKGKKILPLNMEEFITPLTLAI